MNYRSCLKVVAMGDTNGVAIAQEVHESILAAAGCFDPAVTVLYDAPLPQSRVLEFAYVDDHHISQNRSQRGSTLRAWIS